MPIPNDIRVPTIDQAHAHQRIRRLAARAWMEMDVADVPPTPPNFAISYAHLSGTHQELSHRLLALLEGGATPSPEALETLHTECLALPAAFNVEAVEEGSEEIQHAAQDIAEQLAGGQRNLAAYGAVLSQVGGEIERDQTVAGLLQAVATLTAETVRASEHNSGLEQRLTASAARISRLRQSLASVKREATTDPMTGLVNRRGFDAGLRRAMARAKAEAVSLCLLLIDVDRFKNFNDTYGHKTGDLVLRLVGRLLAENVKGKDLAARFGGEEFAIILTGADERAGVMVAEQIRAVLDGKRIVNRGSGQQMQGITVSVGVAGLRPGEGPTSLISRADAALYRAKNTGRNRVCSDQGQQIESVAA
jgi:diguanylate cyclase